MACAVFARGVFVELLAELLPAVDLARFSSTSTRFYSRITGVCTYSSAARPHDPRRLAVREGAPRCA